MYSIHKPPWKFSSFYFIFFCSHMFVLFLKRDSTVVIERISMDGRLGEVRYIVYETADSSRLTQDLSLLYDTDYNYLSFLDRSTNTIKYFSNSYSGRVRFNSVQIPFIFITSPLPSIRLLYSQKMCSSLLLLFWLQLFLFFLLIWKIETSRSTLNTMKKN